MVRVEMPVRGGMGTISAERGDIRPLCGSAVRWLPLSNRDRNRYDGNAHAQDQEVHTMERDWERVPVRQDGRGNGRAAEPAIGELLKQLGSDSSHLVRQEINLAKTELKEAGSVVAAGAAKLGMAAALAIPGLLAFTAFLVVAIGDWIENYWASALIVAVAFLAMAAVAARRGMSQLKSHPLAPRETMNTLRDDAQWARQESQTFKRELTS